MTNEEFEEKIRKMGNAELLDELDYCFDFDPYYREARAIITKELERRLNVIIDRKGKRKDVMSIT